MKSIFIALFSIGLIPLSRAQQITIELMPGHDQLYNQLLVTKKANQSNLGFFSTSSFSMDYHTKDRSEVMSQLYATYAITKNFGVGLGTFYASVPGLSPSVQLQYTGSNKNLFTVIAPRIDLAATPSFDLMSLLEFDPGITGKIRFYSRLQMMFNYSRHHHNRSYQYIRLGIAGKMGAAGLAANFDAYGPKFLYRYNYGLFYRANF